MAKIKVAIFTGNYNHIRDGVSLTLNRLVDFLLRNNVEVLIFAPTIEKPALDHNGTLIAVPSGKLPGRPEYRVSTGFPAKQRRILEDFDPDLVHIATPDILGYKALKWAKNTGKPVVSSFHTHFSSYLKYYKLGFLEPLLWKYLSWFYNHCEQVYVPSQSMAEILQTYSIQTELKIWARGIDTQLFHPSKRDNEWREKHGFKDSDIVITYVSRLVWEKNPDLYADVVKRLQNEYTQVKALIVGDGPALSGLKEQFPDAIYTGFLSGEELAASYAGSDIFFFPSDTETFGNVTLEAMASGLPCVVADATGSKSLVEHNKNGFVIPVESRDEFLTSLKSLITDHTLRNKMGNSSLEKSKQYTWSAINNRLLSFYKEVLSR
jgi:glycosyltransferase involved in cell wall biosynthesis